MIRRFLRNAAGGVALLTAIMLPALLGGTGYALNYMNMSRYHVLLQGAADAAAISSARQLAFMTAMTAPQRDQALQEHAQQMVDIQLLPTQRPAKAKLKITKDGFVEVIATHITKPIFSGLPGVKPAPVSARAMAQALQGENICLLTTEPKAPDALRMVKSARITGPACGVYSNSRDTNGLVSTGNAVLQASLICSAGGIGGGAANYQPGPITDCPVLEDPLASRAPPSPTGLSCLHTSEYVIQGKKNSPVQLSPGRYCGGIRVKGNTVVEMLPGEYLFEGGALLVGGNSTLQGDDVGLYFHDENSWFEFTGSSNVSLSGRVSGPMAGMLVYGNPTAVKRTFVIASSDVNRLVGTVYMPADQLEVSSSAPVGQNSAFTILIVRELQLTGSPDLVFNTDYGATNVPVPDGMRSVGSRARLVK